MVSYLSKRLKRIQERICFTKTELFFTFYKTRNQLWVWHNTENGWWTKRQIQWRSVYHVWKHPFITSDNCGCTMHAKTNPSITIQTLKKISYLLGTKKVEKYTFSNICEIKLSRSYRRWNTGFTSIYSKSLHYHIPKHDKCHPTEIQAHVQILSSLAEHDTNLVSVVGKCIISNSLQNHSGLNN